MRDIRPGPRFFIMTVPMALLIGCSGQSISPILQSNNAAATSSRHASFSETVLYKFGTNQPDGLEPLAGLTNVRGTLYGGTTKSTATRNGASFSITPSGAETLLHLFSKKNGAFFVDNLTIGPGTGPDGIALYGVGYIGGTSGNGTIFKTTLAGRVTVLYNFMGGNDGATPWGSLIDVNGTLYGTTQYGGGSANCDGGCGTIFSITPSGTEVVIHSFSGTDGALPRAALIDVNGTLYGTTFYGGASANGTVFSVSTSGAEHVLYSFAGGKDGANPEAALVAVNGLMYGTTLEGGDEKCPLGFSGCGTVFAITPSGTETVAHRFAGGTDGEFPYGALLDVNGEMYGTTIYGGGSSDVGTIFRINRSGHETVIHSFTGGQDGASPNGQLIDIRRTLYGTTQYGGSGCAYQSGCGTIFSLTL